MIFDGFDTQSIAFAAPDIAATWHARPPISASSSHRPVRGLVGAICTGVIADRIGRKTDHW